MAGAVGKSVERIGRDGRVAVTTLRKGISKEDANLEHDRNGEIPIWKVLRCRIRYFTDGAVIGSRVFVDEAFASVANALDRSASPARES